MPEKSIGVSDSRKILLKSAWLFSAKSEKCTGVRDFRKILEVLGVRWKCIIFLLSLRSALECVIWGKFLKSWECAGSAWFLQLSLRSVLGVRDFRKMLEVLGVRWKCVAHFCYSGGSALGVRESVLECVTNDRSVWKVRTPTHFCSARDQLTLLNSFKFKCIFVKRPDGIIVSIIVNGDIMT